MPENIVGAQVRRIRYQQGLTQEVLAARLNRLGWDISRGTLAKVEAGIRCLNEKELWWLSCALRVLADELYPEAWRKKRGKQTT